MWILLVFFILLALFCPYLWHKTAIYRWKKALSLDKALPIFTRLYTAIDGFALSHHARREHDALDYVYGEIDFMSFIALLSLVKPDNKTVFYDLGSGTGKAVVACAMVFNVKESNGIELFGSLHHTARKQQQALSSFPKYMPASKIIHFFHDDFLHANFNNATLVYINATGFLGETWIAISDRLTQTPACTTVISTSKALKSSAFIVTKITAVQMSWGIVKAYIHQRIKID